MHLLSSDAETTVENIIAQNLQTAQEQVAAKQEETGEYGSENAIIAVMGFFPGFNNYRAVTYPKKNFGMSQKAFILIATFQIILRLFMG